MRAFFTIFSLHFSLGHKKRTPVRVQSNAHRMLNVCSSYAPYDVNPISSPSLLSSAALFSGHTITLQRHKKNLKVAPIGPISAQGLLIYAHLNRPSTEV